MNDERQYHSSKQSDCDDAPGENSFSHGKSPSFQLLVGGVRLLFVGLRLGTAAPPPKPEFSFRRPIIALLCRLKKKQTNGPESSLRKAQGRIAELEHFSYCC